MFEKISRAKFIRDYDGKKMTLLLAGTMNEKNFNRFMNDFKDDDEFYTQAATQKREKRYTGILHKYSKGFLGKWKTMIEVTTTLKRGVILKVTENSQCLSLH